MTDYKLLQDPVVDTSVRSPHKNWKQLVKDGLLTERTVTYNPDAKKLQQQYIDASVIKEEIKENTIFWYPDGKLMGLFLRRVIPVEAQIIALTGLEAMNFPDPTRAECRKAIEFNGPKAKVRAGELQFGFMDRGSVTKTNPTKEQAKQLSCCKDLIVAMNDIYARTLPKPFGEQNRPLPDNHTKEGGIHEEFRIFLEAAFSTISILKSCPTSVHVDREMVKGTACLRAYADETLNAAGSLSWSVMG